jgi:tetratricopeptide (TPR) repeat protein
MQVSISVLTKKAIDASLKGNWGEAIILNSQILEKTPKDIDAKIRLGRAYIQTSEFTKAKKIFKEVLQSDPINAVALKNYKMAAEKKNENCSAVPVNPKNLIKEAGVTTEVFLDIQDKKLTAENFSLGEPLELKLTKKWVEFYKVTAKNEHILLGKIDSTLTKQIHCVYDKGGTCSAFFSGGENKKIHILIRSSVSVFRGERQEVKPYIKRGSIDEPEMEIPLEFEE